VPVSPDLVLLSRVSFRGRPIAGPRLLGLIALLAGDLRTGCGVGRLVEALWPDARPENPEKALQVLVSRARSQFGAGVVARTPGGYRLTLAEDQVDSSIVVARAAAAGRRLRAGDPGAALEHAEAGLGLWGSGPAGSAGEGPLGVLRTERLATHRALVRVRALALARLDRPAEAADPLTSLAAERPRDEEVLVELLRCEVATVGPAAALARYEAYRRALREEWGADPGAAAQAEHRRLLQGVAPVVRSGVVHEPNPLLGRDEDVTAVEALLRSSRVTSIVGPGGLGKTRLAGAVARRASMPTVVVAPLAGLAADGDVAREVAAALDVTDHRGLVAAIPSGPALLVLDNCEHVVAGVAALVTALVAGSSELRILTTSRTPLGLSSEAVYHLPELSLAASTELFGQRARAARPGAELPPAAVEEVCRHLDGLPLAVELAAARVRVMSVAEVARRLGDRFGLLRGGARDAPERHHTLHAVVEWSWNLLSPAGRAAMRALSVFPDGFTAPAAEQVLGTDPLPVLEHLVDHSLLKVSDTAAGTRFRMLETVREFSRPGAESDAAFLRWALAFGVAHHADLFGDRAFDAATTIRAEQENLLQALRPALSRDDRPAIAAITAVLGGLWAVEGSPARLRALLDQTSWPLSHYRPAPELVATTRTALTVAVVATFGFEGPRAMREMVALRRLGPARADTVVGALGRVLGALGDPGALDRMCESTSPLPAGLANALAAYRHEAAGDVAAALKSAHRALDVFTARDLPWLRSYAHCRVAELSLHLENGAEARDHLLAALPLMQRLGTRADAVGVRSWLVLANLQIGDTAEAERWLEGLTQVPLDVVSEVMEAKPVAGYDLAIRAELCLARGEVEEGLRLWRRVADHLRCASPSAQDDLGPWAVEARAVAVVAHARHGALDLVADIAAELPVRAARLLAHPLASPPPYLMEDSLCGTLLLAVGMADLGPAERRAAAEGTADLALAERTAAAVRLVALAERLRFLRNFQPTMSAARAREDAARADRAAYDAAAASYAALDRDRLRAVALELLTARMRDPG
jgi:predicted ATPase